MSWTAVLPDVLRWRDSCNVYAVLGAQRSLIVDAGTGEWLEGAGELPVAPGALLLTHCFRDHTAGAAAAARAGIPVHVPEGERAIFADPAEHFRRRETRLIYDNLWDLFAPVEPVPVAGVLRDYEQLTLAGIELRVVPLPGATPTQVGFVLRTPRSGRLVAFCAETIHSPGRVPRLAPLQYNYQDVVGAVNVAFSADLLRRLEPDVLLPSLGEPIDRAPGEALRSLHENLAAHSWDRPLERTVLDVVGHDRVEPLSPSVWRSTQANAASCFVVGAGGRALAIDYGYWYASGSGTHDVDFDREAVLMPVPPAPERRRPLLHSLDALREQAGVEQIAAVLPTHYHDDHVCGIPLLQRLRDTPCWAPANFSRLLADPAGHRFPCAWPQPIRIDRALALDEPFEWDGVRFQLAPMSGHTRFSALIGWEVDGIRFVHAGDQYGPLTADRPPVEWQRPYFAANYVYRNGASLHAYRDSADWIAAFRPDVVLSGHWPPISTDDRYFDALAEYGRELEARHRRATALGDDQAHFGLDAMAGWIWPYHVHLPGPQAAELEVTVRNPLPTDATLRLRLAGPDGWRGSTIELPAAGRQEVMARMTIVPDAPCRRQPVTVELHADGRPFGQVLEALVTVEAPAARLRGARAGGFARAATSSSSTARRKA
jgi:glyoxylase-like metal-dependent hydrolase (beta-lactamase superfamily II)